MSIAEQTFKIRSNHMENSKIEWCDHTFNPWIGCQKVSPGCDRCYAERMNKFYRWNGGEWGAARPAKTHDTRLLANAAWLGQARERAPSTHLLRLARRLARQPG